MKASRKKYMNGSGGSEDFTGGRYEEGRSRTGAVKVVECKNYVLKEKHCEGGNLAGFIDGSDG